MGPIDRKEIQMIVTTIPLNKKVTKYTLQSLHSFLILDLIK